MSGPWTLYLACLPRRKNPSTSSEDPDGPPTQADRASSELTTIQFFFLALSVLSPFIGALLLKFISSMLAGEEALSWFSTGMFVLATGVRPWTHLMERVGRRIEELYDVIHYPSSQSLTDSEEREGMRAEISQLRSQMSDLERSFAKLDRKLSSETDEIFVHIDDQVDTMEKIIRRTDKKVEKHEIRIKDVEGEVGKLVKGKARERVQGLRLDISNRSTPPATKSYLEYVLPAWLLPSSVTSVAQSRSNKPSSPPSTLSQNHNNNTHPMLSPSTARFTSSKSSSSNVLSPSGNGTSSALKSPSPLRNLSAPPLETIPEEYGFGPVPGVTKSIKVSEQCQNQHHNHNYNQRAAKYGHSGVKERYNGNPGYELIRWAVECLALIAVAPVVGFVRVVGRVLGVWF
jgi:hypothetical protein